ncbi:MAG: response regulator [Pseudomonadota bacterium]
MLDIVMIDDDPVDIELHRRFLEKRCDQIRLTAFLEPNAALEHLSRRVSGAAEDAGVHLIAVDLFMPGDDGFHVAKTLRPLARRLGAALGVLTGSMNEEHRRHAALAGLDFFQTKPLNVAGLATIGRELGLFDVEETGRTFRIFDEMVPSRALATASPGPQSRL